MRTDLAPYCRPASVMLWSLIVLAAGASAALAQQAAEEAVESPAVPNNEQADPQAPQEVASGSHVGELLSADGEQIRMTVDGRNPHTHQITDETQIILNGQPARPEALRKGDRVRVTTEKNNPRVAVKIEAMRGRGPAAPRQETAQPEGRVFPNPLLPTGRPWLGLILKEADGRVVIERVAAGSPAQRAGFEPGDVLVRGGETDISTPQQVLDLVLRAKPQETIEFVVLRNGAEQPLTAQVGQMPAGPGQPPLAGGPLDNDFGRIPGQAMGPEMHLRLAEQNERIERLLKQVVQDVQQLKKDVQWLKQHHGPTALPPDAEPSPGSDPE